MKTDPDTREWSRFRRARNREAGLCVNENKRGTHGPATHGCRCRACWVVHSVGKRAAVGAGL